MEMRQQFNSSKTLAHLLPDATLSANHTYHTQLPVLFFHNKTSDIVSRYRISMKPHIITAARNQQEIINKTKPNTITIQRYNNNAVQSLHHH
jgi:hypothetical protein